MPSTEFNFLFKLSLLLKPRLYWILRCGPSCISRSLHLLCVHACLYKCFSFAETCCPLWGKSGLGSSQYCRSESVLLSGGITSVLYFFPPPRLHAHKVIDMHKILHTQAPFHPFFLGRRRRMREWGWGWGAALICSLITQRPLRQPNWRSLALLLEFSVSHISIQHTLTPVQIIRNFTNGKPAWNSEKACAYM